jgi:energy-coupling factor transporter transmembrane protein EcfT
MQRPYTLTLFLSVTPPLFTQEIALTLLLSLRFMSLVFEESRNLSLGLAARGVDWAAQGTGGSLNLAGRLCLRLFGNLFHR